MSKLEIFPGGDSYREEGRPQNLIPVSRKSVLGGDLVGVKFWPVNLSEKKIKYLTFVFVPYNKFRDPVSYGATEEIQEVRKKHAELYEPVTQNIFKYSSAKDKDNVGRWMPIRLVSYEDLWFDEKKEITDVLIKEVIVQYFDNSEETIRGEEIKNVLCEDSEYYKKYGGHHEDEIIDKLVKEYKEKQEAELKWEERKKREWEKERKKEDRKEKMMITLAAAGCIIPIIIIIGIVIFVANSM